MEVRKIHMKKCDQEDLKNSFENVYNNIKKFKSIREKLKSKFPVTKFR